MARAQQGGVGAVTIWMIVFVALWLTSTVLLVILYTGQEDLNTKYNRMEAELAKTISASEKRDLALWEQASQSSTMVGLMEAERKKTALLASGNEADNSATIESRRDELLSAIIGDAVASAPQTFADASLLDAATRLYGEVRNTHELLDQRQRRVEELEQKVDELTAANTNQQTEFDRLAQELRDQLKETESQRSDFRSETNETVARLESEFESRRESLEQGLADERATRTDVEGKLVKLQERYDFLRSRFGESDIGPEALATARQPDGQILMAVPGDEVVYINLGRSDRLILGLQFNVYSAETGIPADGRGKARIEVVSISDSSAECQVLERHGNEVISQGDLIANPVYDRSRELSFLVIGEFDLNYDGRPEPGGVATIESLITSWGGRLTTEMTALTDFVVVGAAPPRPKAIGEASPEEAKRLEAVRKVYEHYTSTVAEARSLSIPVLPQSVFLQFLGYSGGPG